MARKKNDGRGRLGGRSKGTPNKATSTLREWIAELLDSNREQVTKDLKTISAIERLKVLERLMSYVLSKPSTGASALNCNGELRIGFDDKLVGDDWIIGLPNEDDD